MKRKSLSAYWEIIAEDCQNLLGTKLGDLVKSRVTGRYHLYRSGSFVLLPYGRAKGLARGAQKDEARSAN